MIQTEIILYKNAQYALNGTVNGAAWAYPGVAFTAGSSIFYGNPKYAVQNARWVLAWNPNTFISYTGVQLINADSGPSNPVVMASFLRNGRSTPLVDAVDITSQIQDMCTNGIQKTLAMQTAGNGGNGCLIYSSIIECIWN